MLTLRMSTSTHEGQTLKDTFVDASENTANQPMIVLPINIQM
jgi:hypothetical protein